MLIEEIRVVRLKLPPKKNDRPVAPAWQAQSIATPMSRYPRFRADRRTWTPPWQPLFCQVKLADGTWGLGMTSCAGPVAAIIADHLAPRLVGENALAGEKLWDMLWRMTSPYGPGLSSFAISAVDLALWDAKGKLLGKPVYELLGGPQADRIPCYGTGYDPAWHMELGFLGTKVPCLYGPEDGDKGLAANVECVAAARELAGDRNLMLDCWMSLDVAYAVRLAEQLRPYNLNWIEECLPPDDIDAHEALRERLPRMTLATGEHWFAPATFAAACRRRVVDILQPDIHWCGGLTACLKIAHLAATAGLSVVLHAGGNSPYGQHFTYASPVAPWCEFFTGPPPGLFFPGLQRGMRLQDAVVLPGMAVPEGGYLKPGDAPGFGLQLSEDMLEPL